jgi:hypothetical protein
MIAAGFDPGGTTGVARASLATPDSSVEVLDVHQLKTFSVNDVILAPLWDMLVLTKVQHFDAVRAGEAYVVFEDYVGAGQRSREASRTLKVIGAIKGYAEVLGFQVVTHQPQTRYHRVDEAEAIMAQQFPGPERVHAVSALAHTLAFIKRRREEVKNVA